MRRQFQDHLPHHQHHTLPRREQQEATPNRLVRRTRGETSPVTLRRRPSVLPPPMVAVVLVPRTNAGLRQLGRQNR